MSHCNRNYHYSKREISAFLLVSVIFISGLAAIWFLNTPISPKNSESDTKNDFSQISASSALTESIVGNGANQTVRVYMENKSSSYNNKGSFNISAPTDHSYLTYGDFNFTYQNNYTTDYVIEDDDASNLEGFQDFDFNVEGSNITESENNNINKIAITDGNIDSGIILSSTLIDNNISLVLDANYTDEDFNQTKILGFISSLLFKTEKNLTFSISVKNKTTETWNEIVSTSITASNQRQSIEENIMNTNLEYMNRFNITNVKFIFKRPETEEFNISLYELDFKSIQGSQLSIQENKDIALEFDLKGSNSTINGITTWIRTLNRSKAKDQNAQLSFSLYYANGTIPRTQSELSSKSIEPDSSSIIDQVNISNYSGDEIKFVSFNNTINTKNLPLSNYFVVISSNTTDEIYSLVCIPQTGSYSDNSQVEHILLTGSLSLGNWVYEDYDASGFKINVTRGYMPSDFETDGFINLTIDNIPLEDREIINNDKSNEKWGLGKWTHNFSSYVSSDELSNFNVELNWNTSITSSFTFNVSSFYAKAYSAENATSQYRLDYEVQSPEWVLNYTFTEDDPMFTNWNFTAFWFTYENYHTANRLLDPNFASILGETSGEMKLEDNPVLEKVVLSNTTLNIIDGTYSLELLSINAISDVESFIHYKDYFWESLGFMRGDNMTISADISGPGSIAPSSGDINATLFKPDGSPYKTFIDSSGSRSLDKSILLYEFGNQTFLQVNDSLPTYGKYHLGVFWDNGTLTGCKKIPIYIDHYELSFGNLTYLPNSKKNQLEVQSIKNIGESNQIRPYTLYLASVNKTTQFPSNYYAIKDSGLSEQFTYDKEDYKISINMESFFQNETILNPSESINFKVSLRNLDPNFDVDAKVSVKLVALENDEWVINESESALQTIERQGSDSGNDRQEFTVSVDIPSIDENGIWGGLNSPIRSGASKAIATVYVGGDAIGTYESANISLLVNKTEDEFEGSIISLKISNSQDPALITEFNRDKCIYSPQSTHIIGNIVDENSISSYSFFNASYLLQAASQFGNMNTVPKELKKGTDFNISSVLTTEFGKAIKNKSVICQYYDGTQWNNITSPLADTDSKGKATFEISPSDIAITNNIATLKMAWDGSDDVLNASRVFNVSFTAYPSQLSIVSRVVGSVFYKYKTNYLTVKLTNEGNARLRITDVSLEFENVNPSVEIVLEESLVLENLSPDESTTVKFKIIFQNIPSTELTVNIRVQADNLDTLESYSPESSITVNIMRAQLLESIMNNFIFIMLPILITLWVLAGVYSYSLKQKIETPLSKRKKKKPRRGKYVKPSEIREGEEEKEREEKTDLDSLLEEEGI